MKSLKELQRVWYKKLADKGFNDIENTEIPGRPLKEWHSTLFRKPRKQGEMSGHQPYQQKIEDFYNGPQFDMVCKMLAKRRSLSVRGVRQVWEDHIAGKSYRDIAKTRGLTLHRVTYLIGRLREWMNLL